MAANTKARCWKGAHPWQARARQGRGVNYANRESLADLPSSKDWAEYVNETPSREELQGMTNYRYNQEDN